MLPRIISSKLFSRETVFIIGFALIFAMTGCGGGGGGDSTPVGVTISGTVDDGTANSVIPNAQCQFVDQNGDVRFTANSDANGLFSVVVDPGIDGYINCRPRNLSNLTLSTFASTMNMVVGETINNENITPITTVVAQRIQSENPVDPKARKTELLLSIATGQDPELSMVALLSTWLYKSMLVASINISYSGIDEDSGGGGDGGSGGGVGGAAGDGGNFSPIPNARCEFIVSTDLKNGQVLYSAALSDFLDDGKLNRPDLAKATAYMEPVLQDYEPEAIKAAFSTYFQDGLGKPYFDITDQNGEFFVEIPPNVSGFVRCLPPNQENLVLATYIPELLEDQKLLDERVTPATTVFSTNIASTLGGDLGIIKENYLNDIAGLIVYIGQKTSGGEDVSFFSLCDPSGADEPPPDCEPTVEEKDVGMVAFSATSLFNTFYKNGVNGDYLAALNNMTSNGDIDTADLVDRGISPQQAAELDKNVTEDAATALGTSLGDALSMARIGVTVTDGGQLIPGAVVDIQASGNISCDNCPATTDLAGQATLNLSGVPSSATAITVTASAQGSPEVIAPPVQVAAFATVDLEIAMLAMPGTGSLQVTISPSGAVSAGAQWRVDGGTWRSSGYTQSGLAVGSHTVAFSSISGYTTPGNQTVTINANQTTTASGNYVIVPPATGSLQVTISPSGAVSAGAQWRVDGGTWRSSGYTQSGLAVGSHTVAFSSISGYTTPGNQTVTINANQTTTASGNYVIVPPATGSLQVTISPSGAVSAGAQWRVDGGTWRSSGYTQSGLAVGSHTVAFSSISGYTTPGNQTVTINANQTTTASGNYVIVPPATGSLQVTISPSGAVSAGAQWRVDGGTWRSSGDTLSGLTVGSHTVAFSSISGYTTPGNQTVTINANQTTTASGNYTYIQPTPPTISNISQELIGDGEWTCVDANGNTFLGYYYRISVNYQDSNGDVIEADGAKVRLDGSDFRWFNIYGDGETGSATADPCYSSAQHNRTFRISVVDAASLESNSLSVTVP